MRYRFSDADRERLGITEEWVELDLTRLMFDEAVALEESGYDVDEFLEDFNGHPVVRNGEPVMVDVVEDGKPKQVQKRSVPLRAIGAATWLAARRGGYTGPFEGFTFNMIGLRHDQGEPEGKGDSPDPVSGSSASSTPSRSRRSSASSRGKSRS